MMLTQRSSSIKFLEDSLTQPKNLEHNKGTLVGIIDILLKQEGFPKQNKLLIEFKVKLSLKKPKINKLKSLIKEIKATNE
tara:strand:- start:53 stop:292 length:240 start_codon:yes stop_codon:yes gene_type:complete